MFWAPVWLTLSLPKELHLIMTLQTQRTGAQLFLIHFVSPASQLKLLVPRSFLVYRKYISYLQLCNRVWNHTYLGPSHRRHSTCFEHIIFWIKNQRFLLEKKKKRVQMEQQNADLQDQKVRPYLFRTNSESQFYSSCRKVTWNIFTGGDKIAWVRKVLTPNDVYSPPSLHVIKFDPGHLMKCGS